MSVIGAVVLVASSVRSYRTSLVSASLRLPARVHML